MSSLRDQIDGYVKRVKDLAEVVRGNEQATKQSLIGPFFTMLGYDLTDPRECIPEYKADFGKDRSTKPIDWGFLQGGSFAFFVEAKGVDRKLAGYDEQLADYFAKDPNVKLGILTNGVQWRFFTDVENANVMDKSPFAKWDIFTEEPPPFDVITLIQKAQFNPELIRAYAQRQRAQNLLVGELTRLLEPAPEFTKLAVANIETRNLTAGVVENWKPVVASALNEWARQRMLTAALAAPAVTDDKRGGSKVETTEEELAAFGVVKVILGDECPVEYEDTTNYFKIHLAEKRTWVMCRLRVSQKNLHISVPMPMEKVADLAAGQQAVAKGDWTTLKLDNAAQLQRIAPLLREAYAQVKQRRTAGDDDDSEE